VKEQQGQHYAKVPHDLILDERVSDDAVRLYGRLCEYVFLHWRYRKPWPKDGKIAADTGWSERNIRRRRKELVKTGWAVFEYNGTVLTGITLNDRPILAEDKSGRVLQPQGTDSGPSTATSVLSDDAESEVPPVETARNDSIYSGPAPKDEGAGLNYPAGTRAEGTSIDMVPELVSRATLKALPVTQPVVDTGKSARRARLERALHQHKLGQGYRSGKLDEIPSFEQLYPRKAAA